MAGHPSATCVAFDQLRCATDIQRLLGSDRLRIYTSSDVVGCEISGAVKNVIAVAAGLADGLGYGMNTKAALTTRGLAELARPRHGDGRGPADVPRARRSRRPDGDVRQPTEPQPERRRADRTRTGARRCSAIDDLRGRCQLGGCRPHAGRPLRRRHADL